ncbi:hypothetical protein AHAS_Ahas14G0129100 [Arachis hypogaea]
MESFCSDHLLPLCGVSSCGESQETAREQQHRPVGLVNVDDFLFKTTREDAVWWPDVQRDSYDFWRGVASHRTW